ncbi:major facilitator superfamily MFS_1 [Tolumonas auensis DSM 9187]|uniref:Major facilitator superfamily MFS_1 n=1 Tax=Tolumonas auensis (strain DSM 9187 / NBRC 110442 / TA 4) TaxID=595494 RepID=C4L9E1_TOLAT|nr:MFS transporter [Tolumonas auensis]ACQ92040.1 major facilitator superfamily MFS_1 [Tolumonas auensis DSM 9187]
MEAEVAIESVETRKRTNIRYIIIALLFVVGAINYADRAIFSIAGPAMMKSLNLDLVNLGYLMSTFGWAYVLGQLPGGWLLDRFGARKVYIGSLFSWSLCTLLLGFAGYLGAAAVVTIFALVFMLSICESPAFPANARIVASWFPTHERGTATAIFTTAQYFALVIFLPLMGWLTNKFGWQSVYWAMGVLGIALAVVMPFILYNPKDHPRISSEEFEYIKAGGALVDNYTTKVGDNTKKESSFSHIKQLLNNRLMVGVLIGQFCIVTLVWFFTTWFPIYLAQGRGLSLTSVGLIATIPAISGCLGGILGGLFSDFLLRKKFSLTFARKAPIILGMALAMSIIGCVFVDSLEMIVFFLSLAFFGKGLGALGWAVVGDIAPREIVGLCGGLSNMAGNIAGIVTPIVIGYIVKTTGSFNGALIYVGVAAFMAIFSYVFLVGKISRIELKK